MSRWMTNDWEEPQTPRKGRQARQLRERPLQVRATDYATEFCCSCRSMVLLLMLQRCMIRQCVGIMS